MEQRTTEQLSVDELERDPYVGEVAERLRHARPLPGAPLRAQTRAFLEAVEASGLPASRPRQLWMRAGACALLGAIVLAIVAAGLGGWGPFAG